MKNLTRTILAATIIGINFSIYADQTQSRESIMSATGMFEVNLEPQKDEIAPVGRMLIDKKYSGDFVGKGIGQMISKRTDSGSAIYSAIEEVEGSLDGKQGSFTLIHMGEITADSQSLDVKILVGSGGGELKDISGSLEIIQEENTHKYILSYEL